MGAYFAAKALRHSLRPFRLHHIFNDLAPSSPPPRALSLMTNGYELLLNPTSHAFVSH